MLTCPLKQSNFAGLHPLKGYFYSENIFLSFCQMHSYLKCISLGCRKIPRDLTEASISGAGLSIVAALFMMFLFGMVGLCFHILKFV